MLKDGDPICAEQNDQSGLVVPYPNKAKLNVMLSGGRCPLRRRGDRICFMPCLTSGGHHEEVSLCMCGAATCDLNHNHDTRGETDRHKPFGFLEDLHGHNYVFVVLS